MNKLRKPNSFKIDSVRTAYVLTARTGVVITGYAFYPKDILRLRAWLLRASKYIDQQELLLKQKALKSNAARSKRLKKAKSITK
jgi:hypothetical protein